MASLRLASRDPRGRHVGRQKKDEVWSPNTQRPLWSAKLQRDVEVWNHLKCGLQLPGNDCDLRARVVSRAFDHRYAASNFLRVDGHGQTLFADLQLCLGRADQLISRPQCILEVGA